MPERRTSGKRVLEELEAERIRWLRVAVVLNDLIIKIRKEISK